MNHPSSCTDPHCALPSYAAHLRGIQISPAAVPSRAINRSPGQPDEPVTVTREREHRWDRENRAYRTLCASGIVPDTLAEAPKRLRELGG